MSTVGEREIRTQRRVAAFFHDALGYVHLGDWQDRAGDDNVEETLLTGWRQGHDDTVIARALRELRKAAAVSGSQNLYDANRAVYGLLREMSQLCEKERLLEIVHDFIVFDAGIKKTCRHNQYFGVRAAQAHVQQRQGGIIWHTQGSGKSLIMVWLAKWIREHVRNGRVLIITDRTELDEQIEQVFLGVSEQLERLADCNTVGARRLLPCELRRTRH